MSVIPTSEILLVIGLILGSAVLVSHVEYARRPWAKLAISLLVAVAVFRSTLIVQLLWAAIPYAILLPFAARLADKPEQEKRWKASTLVIVGLVVAYLLSNYATSHGPIAIGRSAVLAFAAPNMWLLLRLISFVWEFGSRRVEMTTPVEYAIWALLPFTIIGPLLPHSDFHKDHKRNETRSIVIPLLVVGAVQLGLGILLGLATPKLLAMHHKVASLSVMLITGPWSFYLFAAGLFQIMESAAPAWGLKLERSFENPFGKKNIAEFWSAWNITATKFFRDVLFYQRWGLERQYLYANLMIVFAAVGFWHGANAYWISWGLLHGIGFCIFTCYRRWRKNASFGFQPPPLLSRGMCVLATYLFVCLCWYIPNKIVPLLESKSPGALVARCQDLRANQFVCLPNRK